MKQLNDIQKKLIAPKWQYNNFGKYKYRSCEDIVEAVKPLLNGSILTMSDDIVEIGWRVYVKATVTLKDWEESISVTAFAREPNDKKGMDESQITGTASSYARKYALNGLFAIDDTKDADNESYKNEDNARAEYKWKFDLMDYIQRIKDETDTNALDSLYTEFMKESPTEKQVAWFIKDAKARKEQLLK